MDKHLMGSTGTDINTHLTGADAIHLQELIRQSGRPTAEILRAALRTYHARYLAPKPNPQQLLARFTARGEGPQDLSSRYKDYLSQKLTHKHTSTS